MKELSGTLTWFTISYFSKFKWKSASRPGIIRFRTGDFFLPSSSKKLISSAAASGSITKRVQRLNTKKSIVQKSHSQQISLRSVTLPDRGTLEERVKWWRVVVGNGYSSLVQIKCYSLQFSHSRVYIVHATKTISARPRPQYFTRILDYTEDSSWSLSVRE